MTNIRKVEPNLPSMSKTDDLKLTVKSIKNEKAKLVRAVKIGIWNIF